MKNIYVIDDSPWTMEVFIKKIMNYYIGAKKSVSFKLLCIHPTGEEPVNKTSDAIKRLETMVQEKKTAYWEKYEIKVEEYFNFSCEKISYNNGKAYENESNLLSRIRDIVTEGGILQGVLLIDMILINENNIDTKRINDDKEILSHMLFFDNYFTGKCMIYTNYLAESKVVDKWREISKLPENEKIYCRSEIDGLSSFNVKFADRAYELASVGGNGT